MDALSIALALLLMVESGDRADAKGDYNGSGAQAVGCMQIWKTTVDDANRIVGTKRYTYADRKSRSKSLEMARVILTHYGSTKRLGHKATVEDYVRMWKVRSYRGERTGYAKASTDSHWRKARALIRDRSYTQTLMSVMPVELAETDKTELKSKRRV